MKGKLVYIPLFLMVAAMLAGCSMLGTGNDNAAQPSAAPYIAEPDMGDGYVRDKDGFIDEEDSGISSRIGDDMGKNRIMENSGTQSAAPSPDTQQGTVKPKQDSGVTTKR